MNAIDLTLLRARAADAVDRLLDLIDAIDGDVDLELTSVETHGRGFPIWLGQDDDEDAHDAERELEHRIAGGQGL